MELTPPARPLTDGTIVLRLREQTDWAVIVAASHDPETLRWLDDRPISIADESAPPDPRETWALGERAPFVIAEAATDRPIGLFTLRVVAEGTASLAVSVFPEARGRGAGRAALGLVGRWALTEAGFQRVEAEADVANEASRRTIEKAGFRREGILRDHCDLRGVRHDCEMFSLVRADIAQRMRAETISTKRLVLTPLDTVAARALLAGEISSLESADGWPHDDTLDALRMATAPGGSTLVWLVTLDGLVIGECGTAGGPDDRGDIEIGYGLAAEHRRRGYGNELVEALSRWLMAQPEVEQVVASGVLAENVASRRALENAGFVLEREEGGLTWYALCSR